MRVAYCVLSLRLSHTFQAIAIQYESLNCNVKAICHVTAWKKRIFCRNSLEINDVVHIREVCPAAEYTGEKNDTLDQLIITL